MTAKNTEQDEELKKSQQKYRNLFENDIVGMYRTRIDGSKVLEVNQALCNILGFTKEEILTKPAIIRWADPRAREVMVNNLMKYGSVVNYEADILTSSGEIRNCLLSLKIYPQESCIEGILIDITERKQAEVALLQSEAKYRFLTENMNDIIWTADLDFNVTYDSPVVEKILGYTGQERTGQKAIALLTPESSVQALEVLNAELKRDQEEGVDPDRTIKLELEYYHKNGSTVWMECAMSAIRDDTGKPIGIYGVSHDISDRIRAAAAQRESENRFRSLIQNSLDILIILDENGFMIYETPSLENILGYQPGYLIGKSPFELTHPSDLERVAYDLNEVYLKTNPGIPTEFRFRKADGTWVYLEAIGQNLLEDPAINGIVITARDITERKRKEEALKESEQRFSAIFENAADGILLADIETNKFYMGNKQICEALGYSAEEIKNMTVTDIHPAKDLPYVLDQFKKLVSQKIKVAKDIPVKRNDGGIYYADVSAFPIPFMERIYLLGIFRDITERKQAEEELKKHRDYLEEIVQDRTAELNKANIELKREIEVRKTTETSLRSRELELEKGRQELQEMNSALRVLLKQREEDKANMEKNIMSNIKTSILPYIEKLEAAGIEKAQMRDVSMLKSLLGEITSSFIRKVSSEFLGFTPNEIKIASLIKEGKSSKKIAEILNISLNTVHTYRYKIRIKTGLKNNKVNLRSYLQTLG